VGLSTLDQNILMVSTLVHLLRCAKTWHTSKATTGILNLPNFLVIVDHFVIKKAQGLIAMISRRVRSGLQGNTLIVSILHTIPRGLLCKTTNIWVFVNPFQKWTYAVCMFAIQMSPCSYIITRPRRGVALRTSISWSCNNKGLLAKVKRFTPW
jgi:hypothetical protein